MAKDGAILPVLAADGQPPPDWSIPPVVRHPLWVAIVLAGFHDVSTERAIGFGLGPIPWSKIVERGSMPPPLGPGLRGERLADLAQLRAEPRGLSDVFFSRLLYKPESRFARLAGGGSNFRAGPFLAVAQSKQASATLGQHFHALSESLSAFV